MERQIERHNTDTQIDIIWIHKQTKYGNTNRCNMDTQIDRHNTDKQIDRHNTDTQIDRHNPDTQIDRNNTDTQIDVIRIHKQTQHRSLELNILFELRIRFKQRFKFDCVIIKNSRVHNFFVRKLNKK